MRIFSIRRTACVKDANAHKPHNLASDYITDGDVMLDQSTDTAIIFKKNNMYKNHTTHTKIRTQNITSIFSTAQQHTATAKGGRCGM